MGLFLRISWVSQPRLLAVSLFFKGVGSVDFFWKAMKVSKASLFAFIKDV